MASTTTGPYSAENEEEPGLNDSYLDDDPNHDGSPADGKLNQSIPMQKRRRVGRACDECRRKKIKCDGKQPCTHCTVYSYGAHRPILPLPKQKQKNTCMNLQIRPIAY